MTGFIRPEARAVLWRWREALGGGGLLCAGALFAFGPGGLVGVLGAIAMLAGGALIAMGLQRGRFRGRRGGPGIAELDEGQITYFGPLSGGTVALGDLSELALIRTRQTPHWRLTTSDGQLFIPVDAEGADGLFDAFTVLPGLKMQRMLAALQDKTAQDVVIWIAPARDQSPIRLH